MNDLHAGESSSENSPVKHSTGSVNWGLVGPIFGLLGVLAVLFALWHLIPWRSLMIWAATEQREYQTLMARALRGIQAGDAFAVWSLCSATAAYGFVHALGPGHGKVLIGGAAMASGVTLRRLGLLTLLSSLAQAGTAIALVGGLAYALHLRSDDLVTVTEDWLAPASYLVISAIGLILLIRGVRAVVRTQQHTHHTACGCGHAHAPSVDDLKTLGSTRDAVALIASIAMRPCTGALFVLVIAAQFDAFWIGALSVVTMGLGTAAFNLLVAGSGVGARRLSVLSAKDGKGIALVTAGLHVLGGLLILGLSSAMLAAHLFRLV